MTEQLPPQESLNSDVSSVHFIFTRFQLILTIQWMLLLETHSS